MAARTVRLSILATLAIIASSPAVTRPPDTWNGLMRVKSAKMNAVYLLPKADFRTYTKVMLEPAEVAFPEKAKVDENYLELAGQLLDQGVYPAFATHDEAIIRKIRAMVEERKTSRDGFEFQMLYGIRRDLQRQLVKEGYRLRLYVPFGKAWYPYYMRRLAERPANVFFMLRNLVRR